MKLLAAVVVMVGLGVSPSSADTLQLSFDNGFVTLNAENVPVRQILAEWARRGQTRVVNGERLNASVTLQLPHVPEKQALDTILRSAGGYMAAARQVPTPELSQFDRIIVMPTAPGTPVRASAPPPQMAQPHQEPPPAMVDDQDDPIPPPGVPNPGVQTPDQPGAAQQQPVMPAPMPTPGIQPMPPGMTPGQTGQPGQQVQPGQPMPEDPDGEDSTPTGAVAVPGQGAVTSPAPGQLPIPPQQPNPQ